MEQPQKAVKQEKESSGIYSDGDLNESNTGEFKQSDSSFCTTN
jgi:hypothetical protein